MARNKETAALRGTTLGVKPGKEQGLHGQGAYEPNEMVPVGNFTGTTLVKCPQTGYMVPAPNSGGNPVFLFTAEKKIRFIELSAQLWPNMFRVCNEIKVHYGTYKNHLIVDEQFAKDMDLVKQQKVDHVEGNVFEFANRPANFMDRMAILRAYRGELYNPVQKVQHVGQELSKDEALRRRASLATVVDPDVARASGQILEAEVVTDSVVPVAASTEPAQSPAGKMDVSTSLGGEGGAAEQHRDPLLDIVDRKRGRPKKTV